MIVMELASEVGPELFEQREAFRCVCGKSKGAANRFKGFGSL